jgi:hypothetical protein
LQDIKVRPRFTPLVRPETVPLLWLFNSGSVQAQAGPTDATACPSTNYSLLLLIETILARPITNLQSIDDRRRELRMGSLVMTHAPDIGHHSYHPSMVDSDPQREASEVDRQASPSRGTTTSTASARQTARAPLTSASTPRCSVPSIQRLV